MPSTVTNSGQLGFRDPELCNFLRQASPHRPFQDIRGFRESASPAKDLPRY